MKKYTLGNSKEGILLMFPEKSIKTVLVGEKKIAVVRIGLDFYSFQSQCPHRGASLINGNINSSREIICPLHEYRFDLEFGYVRAGSCPNLEIYPATLTEMGLEITLP
ncbi:Rieske (2Fe-2S) protein [Algoriphagus sp. SE2]|uniref:Rieske (2Fe-2S) protein n=1 Tax=Algoriphagus sp. SE2 TaxID=3141536 RepID=UPI0031CCF031